MDKYGVVTENYPKPLNDSIKEGTLRRETKGLQSVVCPNCGTAVDAEAHDPQIRGGSLVCPNCGSKPFENK